jgi:hypothetical protein
LDIPEQPALSPQAAEGILAIDFSQDDKDCMNGLAAKARAGTLTPPEQVEAEAYSRIGNSLGILKSMVRGSRTILT